MSLVFWDGFDHYLAPLQKWDNFSVSGATNGDPHPFILPAAGRNGRGCLTMAGRNNSGSAFVLKNVPNTATYILGFAMFLPGTSVQQVIAKFMDGATLQVDFRVDSTGHIQVTRNGTQLASSTNAMSFSTWYYIEIKVTVDPTVGVVQVNVNGSNTGWINFSGNTRASSTSQIGQIQIGASNTSTFGALGTPTIMFDDLYLLNTSGSFNTTFLGDTSVYGQLPTGNGTLNQYTQNEQAWVASTEVYIGQVIKDSNGNLQIVTSVASDAKTGGSAPTWATGAGNTTTDNHVTWTNLGASAQFRDVGQNPPEGSGIRVGSIAVALGTAIWDDNKNLQLCTTAGTTSGGTSTPTWNVTIGGTTVDGTVTWTNLGPGESVYLSDVTVGHISRFTFPAITNASSIFAAGMTMRARKDDSNTRSIRGATLSGGTTGDTGADLALSQGSYLMVQGAFESDPNTGAAWTQSGLNAAEFGVKTTA